MHKNMQIQIILRMCKASSVRLQSIHNSVVSNDFVSEHEGPEAVWSDPALSAYARRHVFACYG